MAEKKDKETSEKGPAGLPEWMGGDSETRKILSLWKGRRFLKKLQRVCSENEPDEAGEGMRR